MIEGIAYSELKNVARPQTQAIHDDTADRDVMIGDAERLAGIIADFTLA